MHRSKFLVARHGLPPSFNGHGQINAQPQPPTSTSRCRFYALILERSCVPLIFRPPFPSLGLDVLLFPRKIFTAEGHAQLCRGLCVWFRSFPSPGSGGSTAAGSRRRSTPRRHTVKDGTGRMDVLRPRDAGCDGSFPSAHRGRTKRPHVLLLLH